MELPAVAVHVEPNNDFNTTNTLAIGGYLLGQVGTALSDVDVARVSVPTAGQYTFETVAWDGACGFTLEEDTILQLYDAQGTLLAESDNVDGGALNFCSRISTTLSAGTYYVAVWGWNGNFEQYAVLARSGP
jgi:hypothetical protein